MSFDRNRLSCETCGLLSQPASVAEPGYCPRCGVALEWRRPRSIQTTTVALVQLQPLMSVKPGLGVAFFATVVVLTMIVASTFDPRLIWDAGFN